MFLGNSMEVEVYLFVPLSALLLKMVSPCCTVSHLCQWVEDQSTHLSTNRSKRYSWHIHRNHQQILIMGIPSGHILNYPIHFKGSNFSNRIGIVTPFGHVCCGWNTLNYGTGMCHGRRLALKENLHVVLMSVVFLDDTHSFALLITIAFKMLNILGRWPINSLVGLPTKSSFIIVRCSNWLCTRVDGLLDNYWCQWGHKSRIWQRKYQLSTTTPVSLCQLAELC